MRIVRVYTFVPSTDVKRLLSISPRIRSSSSMRIWLVSVRSMRDESASIIVRILSSFVGPFSWTDELLTTAGVLIGRSGEVLA